MLIVSAREFSQLNANRLFNGNMCPIAFRSARGNSRVDCFGFGGCLSLPLPRSGEGVWSLWFDAHAGGLADVSLTQVPQPPRSPPRLVVPSDLWICLAWGICPASPRVKALHQGTSPLPIGGQNDDLGGVFVTSFVEGVHHVAPALPENS